MMPCEATGLQVLTTLHLNFPSGMNKVSCYRITLCRHLNYHTNMIDNSLMACGDIALMIIKVALMRKGFIADFS